MRRCQPRIVDQQHVGLRGRAEPARKAAIAVSDAQFLNEVRQADVQLREALPAGGIAERAGEPGGAAVGGAGDQANLVMADRVAAADLEPRLVEQAVNALGVAERQRAVDDQGDSFLEEHRRGAGAHRSRAPCRPGAGS